MTCTKNKLGYGILSKWNVFDSHSWKVLGYDNK